MKKKAEIHDIFEYGFAKKVVKDAPDLIKNLDKCAEILYNGREYRDIADVLFAISEAKIMLQLHYETYSKVVKTKGKRSGKK